MVRIATFAAAGAALLASPVAAQTMLPSGIERGETLLQVQATGRAYYAPDVATISVGVVSTGTTAREATDANAKTMTAVIAAVRGAGVDARYVRTQQINVQPRFARNSPNDYEGQAQITGYVARNTVTVRVVKLASAPDVIAAAFGAGANSVNGPNLSNSDPDAALEKARGDAVANAQKEAEDYARAFGLRVVRVLRIGARGTQTGYDDIVVSGNRLSAPPPPPPPLMMAAPVAGGEMIRTYTVWVDYALAK
ncbi:SIMPL domain-containing protein [Sphingomonas sp. RS2018]